MANYQAAPAPTAEDPGKTLGIVGLVLAIIAPVIGIIVSAIARSQSQKAGFQNQFAKIGLIVGIILTAVWLIGVIAYVVFFAAMIGANA
jgi:hypothetical protein